MRLISGKLGRRVLKTDSKLHYRPTTEMVRAAIFSTLTAAHEGAARNWEDYRVLDLYAGTGALGFEAISRGAGLVVFVEKSVRHANLIRENARLLGVEDQVKVLQMDASLFLRSSAGRSSTGLGMRKQGDGHDVAGVDGVDERFDLIFADPPYDLHPGDALLDSLLNSGLLQEGSRIVIECRKDLQLAGAALMLGHGLSLVQDKLKNYGETAIFYYTANKQP